MEKLGDEIAISIVETASDALNTPVEELPPLSEAVDVDALNAIIPSTATDQPPDVTVTFSYADLTVGVRAGNTVFVSPTHDEKEDLIGEAYFDERETPRE